MRNPYGGRVFCPPRNGGRGNPAPTDSMWGAGADIPPRGGAQRGRTGAVRIYMGGRGQHRGKRSPAPSQGRTGAAPQDKGIQWGQGEENPQALWHICHTGPWVCPLWHRDTTATQCDISTTHIHMWGIYGTRATCSRTKGEQICDICVTHVCCERHMCDIKNTVLQESNKGVGSQEGG